MVQRRVRINHWATDLRTVDINYRLQDMTVYFILYSV